MLTDDRQYDTVFAIGGFLDIIEVGNTKYVLYAIDRFFVEVKWDVEKGE
ncbi:MAG: hypothetical protein MUO53_07055 [Maribacter sp.]|nr:hypothetical protein [Maribacter sp.]